MTPSPRNRRLRLRGLGSTTQRRHARPVPKRPGTATGATPLGLRTTGERVDLRAINRFLGQQQLYESVENLTVPVQESLSRSSAHSSKSTTSLSLIWEKSL